MLQILVIYLCFILSAFTYAEVTIDDDTHRELPPIDHAWEKNQLNSIINGCKNIIERRIRAPAAVDDSYSFILRPIRSTDEMAKFYKNSCSNRWGWCVLKFIFAKNLAAKPTEGFVRVKMNTCKVIEVDFHGRATTNSAKRTHKAHPEKP